MNYFQLYELPVSFYIDISILKERYDTLRQQFQPVSAVDVELEELRVMEEKALLVEKGYEVFKSLDNTIVYVLAIKELLPDGENYELSEQFKMEVHDITEELAELEMDENQEQLMNVEQKVHTLMINNYEDVAAIIESYKEDTGTEEALLQVKDFYHQKKYLERILDRISGIRNIASPL